MVGARLDTPVAPPAIALREAIPPKRLSVTTTYDLEMLPNWVTNLASGRNQGPRLRGGEPVSLLLAHPTDKVNPEGPLAETRRASAIGAYVRGTRSRFVLVDPLRMVLEQSLVILVTTPKFLQAN